MTKLDWCMKVKNGLELVEQNENLCTAYFKKADNALLAAGTLKDNREWEISSRYYAMYFALYALLMKAGIKCENHNCTIEFMKQCFKAFFSEEDANLLRSAMKARVDVQYYTDRSISDEQYLTIKEQSPHFIVKCKEICKKMNKEIIDELRKRIVKPAENVKKP